MRLALPIPFLKDIPAFQQKTSERGKNGPARHRNWTRKPVKHHVKI